MLFLLILRRVSIFFFFFSSRRRHTRFDCDWSSDVCSSDLGGASRALYEPVIQRLRELSSAGLVMTGEREEGALLGTVRPTALPPGRGWLVTRKEGVRLGQLRYFRKT